MWEVYFIFQFNMHVHARTSNTETHEYNEQHENKIIYFWKGKKKLIISHFRNNRDEYVNSEDVNLRIHEIQQKGTGNTLDS